METALQYLHSDPPVLLTPYVSTAPPQATLAYDHRMAFPVYTSVPPTKFPLKEKG